MMDEIVIRYELECEGCGKELEFEILHAANLITVKVCTTCMETSRELYGAALKQKIITTIEETDDTKN